MGNSNDTVVYIIAGGVTGFLLIVLVIVIASLCRSRKDREAKARRRAQQKEQRRLDGNETLQRTQVYVNDCIDDDSEKPVNYSDLWGHHEPQFVPQQTIPTSPNNNYPPSMMSPQWGDDYSRHQQHQPMMSPFQQELQQRWQKRQELPQTLP